MEFFGTAAERTPNPVGLLLYKGPYVIVPLLLIRMRAPLPFARRF